MSPDEARRLGRSFSRLCGRLVGRDGPHGPIRSVLASAEIHPDGRERVVLEGFSAQGACARIPFWTGGPLESLRLLLTARRVSRGLLRIARRIGGPVRACGSAACGTGFFAAVPLPETRIGPDAPPSSFPSGSVSPRLVPSRAFDPFLHLFRPAAGCVSAGPFLWREDAEWVRFGPRESPTPDALAVLLPLEPSEARACSSIEVGEGRARLLHWNRAHHETLSAQEKLDLALLGGGETSLPDGSPPSYAFHKAVASALRSSPEEPGRIVAERRGRAGTIAFEFRGRRTVLACGPLDSR